MTSSLLSQSLNLQWASIIIHTLVKNGINTFFISPGNRNLPLITALVHHPEAVTLSCFDERAAGYRALGYAKAAGKPGVLVCTSGTAIANYYPAVIEASRDEIPMIVVSADRPPELVECDANQTINQVGIFDRFCLKSLSLPCPSQDVSMDALISDVGHLCGFRSGPVHINCPYREPLIPPALQSNDSDRILKTDYLKTVESALNNQQPDTQYHPVHHIPDNLNTLKALVTQTRRGMVVVGRLNYGEDRSILLDYINKLNWPTFCDMGSGLKSAAPESRTIPFFDHPEAIRIIQEYDPETVLQFGTGLVSKHYYQSILPGKIKNRILITPRKGVRDPSRQMKIVVQTQAQSFIQALGHINPQAFDSEAAENCTASLKMLALKIADAAPEEILSYPRIARIVSDHIPEHDALFLGNSITIRAFDMTHPVVGKPIHVISNRGVSGIEGNLATSIGFAEGRQARVTAVLGDIAFLHDLNSLMLLRQSCFPVVIILINNQGGRIFERLPVNAYPDIISPNMTCPHDLQFKNAADQFNIAYTSADTPVTLETAYQKALKKNTSHLIEVHLSPEKDLAVFNAGRKVRLT